MWVSRVKLGFAVLDSLLIPMFGRDVMSRSLEELPMESHCISVSFFRKLFQHFRASFDFSRRKESRNVPGLWYTIIVAVVDSRKDLQCR